MYCQRRGWLSCEERELLTQFKLEGISCLDLARRNGIPSWLSGIASSAWSTGTHGSPRHRATGHQKNWISFIHEALGIDIKNISSDCTTIRICQKAWRGQIHDYLKSDTGKREIDLHSTVAAMLKDFIGDRTSRLMFSTDTGRQLFQSKILRGSLHPILATLENAPIGRSGPKTEVGAVEELAVSY